MSQHKRYGYALLLLHCSNLYMYMNLSPVHELPYIYYGHNREGTCLHNVTTMSKNKLVCHLTKNGLNYYQSWWKLPDVLKKAFTAQKMKFSIKDFFSKCNQIRSFLQIWSHLLKKSLMKNFIFSAVFVSEQLQKYFRLQVVS